MQKLLVDKVARIIKAKKKLEEALNVKIENRGKEIFLEGDGEDEYIAEKVIEAIDFGFSIQDAIDIKKYERIFEILNIKDYTKNKNLERVRGRVIGKAGKALKTVSDLTECRIELKDNSVGIIGDPELIEKARKAIIAIVQGAKHSNVYNYLEKHPLEPIHDLGLKDPKDKL